MIATIISILISIGYIATPQEYHSMSTSEQQEANVIAEDIYEI